MALYKVGSMLRSTLSASVASNAQSSMLTAIRCMSSNLFGGGISHNTTNQSLKDAFSTFNEGVDARDIIDKDSGRSRARDLLKKFSLRKKYEDLKPKIKEDTLSHFPFKKHIRGKKSNTKWNKKKKRPIKKIELPTHYVEVNYRTLQAVVFYRPNIGHIPHNIKMKDLNLLL